MNNDFFAWLHTPSTNAGIAAVLTAAAGYFSGAMDAHTAALAALAGIVAILLPEKKS